MQPLRSSPRATAARLLAAATSVLAAAGSSFAQAAFFTPSGTQPGEGVFTLRPRVEYRQFGNDPEGDFTSRHEVVTSLQIGYGISGDAAVSVDIPTIYRLGDRRAALGGGSDGEFGLGDILVTGKYRLVRADTGPLDTFRLSLIGGLEIPTGTGPFSSGSFDPIVGAAATIIRGRHGLSLSPTFKINTGTVRPGDNTTDGPEDIFRFDAAYLYRIAPEKYTRDTTGSWYVVAELNTMLKTDGDRSMIFAPGVLYEGTTWACEITVQAPVYQDMDHTAELRWGVGFELRFQF